MRNILCISLLILNSSSFCVNYNPVRRSTKKKPLKDNYLEMPSKKKKIIPGDKYKEPEFSVYEFLDGQALINELKQIEEQKALRASKTPWYKKIITLLSPFGCEEKE